MTSIAEKVLLYQKNNVQRNRKATKETFKNKKKEVVKLGRQKSRFEEAHFEMLHFIGDANPVKKSST